MKYCKLFFTFFLFLSITSLMAQKPKPPIMGWSSWNNFRVNINEHLIKQQADAMISSGLYKAGYRFINIDDGYFGGRDSAGNLFLNKKKFPSSMQSLVDYIHSKKLKAGIYSDAGKNTCGSIWDKDTNGINVGLYGHIAQDCNLFFKQWKFDFIKVDWCGGKQMNLNDEFEYLKIIDSVKSINSNIVFNICRWQFPGIWAIKKADSWRISGDIESNFNSILKIIDLDSGLYKYASPGHYNDMDMLQVGRGMSYDEDKAHFSMWCMLNSPLLAGNDLRSMTEQTIQILTNKEIIAIDQDINYPQAQKIFTDGSIEIWVKKLGDKYGSAKAVAILNRSEQSKDYVLTPEKLNVTANSRVRDLWLHKELGKTGSTHKFIIPKHGITVLKIY